VGKQEIRADPFGLNLREIHAPCNDRQLVVRDDRDLPLVAYFRARLVPGLARSRTASGAFMEIAGNAVEGQFQRLDAAGDEIFARRMEQAGNPAAELFDRTDFDLTDI